MQRPDGSRVGLLRDLTIDLDGPRPLVRRLVVGSHRHVHALVPWEAVASFEHALVLLGPDDRTLPVDLDLEGELPLHHGEVLLGRDVLDTQIVDVGGARLARVADVLLTRLPDDHLLVAAIDIGFGAVCRRLGLGVVADRMPERAIEWDNLHLTSARGHLVQLRTPKAAVHRLDDRELAALLSRLSVAAGADVLHAVGPAQAGAALARTHADLAGPLVAALDEAQLAPALDALPDAEAHRLRALRDLPRRRRLLRHRRRRPRGPAGPGPGSGPTDTAAAPRGRP